MSLQSLTNKDEVWVFPVSETQDDMMGQVVASSTRRRKLKCRMVPISITSQLVQSRPELVEGYQAYFAADPEITLDHAVLYKGEVYDVVAAVNLSGMGWLWEVTLQHHPGAEIAA